MGKTGFTTSSDGEFKFFHAGSLFSARILEQESGRMNHMRVKICWVSHFFWRCIRSGNISATMTAARWGNRNECVFLVRRCVAKTHIHTCATIRVRTSLAISKNAMLSLEQVVWPDLAQTMPCRQNRVGLRRVPTLRTNTSQSSQYSNR